MDFRSKPTCCPVLLALSILCTAASRVATADWPTYRGDAQRSGAARDGLRLPLAERWVHRPTHPPQPATIIFL